MLVEIPDPEVILGVILAFLVGLGVIIRVTTKYVHSSNPKMKWLMHHKSERLEYYERQLIDMKIRLDALEIQGIEEKTEDPNLELKQFLEKLAKNETQEKEKVEEVSLPKNCT